MASVAPLVTANPQSRPQQLAQRLTRWAGLHPPVDVESAARRLGIDIEEVCLSSSVTGLLVREDPGRWLIILNSRINHPGRRRFTIAHELGHWTLHRPYLQRTSLELSGEWEREADEFASHLLLPTEELEWRVRYGSLACIERDFGVSTSAANMALRNRFGYHKWW